MAAEIGVREFKNGISSFIERVERPQAGAARAGRVPRRGAAGLGLRDRGKALIVYLDTSALIKLLVDEDGTRGRTTTDPGGA